MTRSFKAFLTVLLTSLLISACGGDNPFVIRDDFSTVPEPYELGDTVPDTTETGLIIYVLEEGQGEFTVQLRDQIAVYFTGRTLDGEIFDSSYKNSNTDPASLSVLSLIQGFRQGVLGMKEGGRRVLIIPPELGYGGTSNVLRDDTLRFDVELDAILSN